MSVCPVSVSTCTASFHSFVSTSILGALFVLPLSVLVSVLTIVGVCVCIMHFEPNTCVCGCTGAFADIGRDTKVYLCNVPRKLLQMRGVPTSDDSMNIRQVIRERSIGGRDVSVCLWINLGWLGVGVVIVVLPLWKKSFHSPIAGTFGVITAFWGQSTEWYWLWCVRLCLSPLATPLSL